MFIYPDNLKAKATLWLWQLRDVAVIGAAFLLSVLALAQAGTMLPLVGTVLYAFLTIQVEGSSVLDFLRRAACFLFLQQQFYEWGAGTVTRKEKLLLHQRQTTRQLMGITRLTEHGAVCSRDELLFYLLRPDNLSILSPEGIRGRVRALTGLLQGMTSLELLALDSRESFLKNKQYYQRRLEEEPEPALRELLRQDMEHLDARQSSTAASREFALVCRLDSKAAEDRELPRRLEKQIQDHGFHVRLAGEQDVKRILAVYYQQDMVTEHFDSIDGERWVTEYG